MNKKPLCLLLLGLVFLGASSAHAAVTVRYDQPEKYADLGLSGSLTPNIQADLIMRPLLGSNT